MRYLKNKSKIHTQAILLGILFSLFLIPTVNAAPNATCNSNITATFPGLEETKNFANTEICQYQTTCRTNQSDSDSTQGIIVPKDRTKIKRTYFYLGGIGGGDPADHCLGSSKFCSHVETKQDIAIVIFNKKTTPSGGSTSEWLKDSHDANCFANEAIAVASELGIQSTNYSLMAHSGGGRVADRILQSNQSLEFDHTLLFDACYGTWCQDIIQKPNRGQTLIYISENTREGGDNSTLEHSEETYALNPTNTIGIKGTDKTLPHGKIANRCFTDHIDNPADDKRCNGRATVVYGGSTKPRNPTSTKTTEPPKPEVFDPKLNIKIPGLSLTPASELNKRIENKGDGIYLNNPNIGEYLSAIYRFGIAISSIVAIIMIITGGLQWIISRGDSSAITSAKKRITNAIIGLGLALGSYSILYIINPELLKFQNLKILYIQREDLPITDHDDHDDIFSNPGNEIKRTSGPRMKGIPLPEHPDETVGNCIIIYPEHVPLNLDTFSDGGAGQCLLKIFTSNQRKKLEFLGKRSCPFLEVGHDAFKKAGEKILASNSPIVKEWVAGWDHNGCYVDGLPEKNWKNECLSLNTKKNTVMVVDKKSRLASRRMTKVAQIIYGQEKGSIRGDMHSVGLAIDMYAHVNPDFRNRKKIPEGEEHAGKIRPIATNIPYEVATALMENGFQWLGGSNDIDAMHFQYLDGACFNKAPIDYPKGEGCCTVIYKGLDENRLNFGSDKNTYAEQFPTGDGIPTFEQCIKNGGTNKTYAECLGPEGEPGSAWIRNGFKGDGTQN